MVFFPVYLIFVRHDEIVACVISVIILSGQLVILLSRAHSPILVTKKSLTVLVDSWNMQPM